MKPSNLFEGTESTLYKTFVEIVIKEELVKRDKDIIKKAEEGLELHTHNSIPCYTGEEDEGCTTCIRNKVLEEVIARLKGELWSNLL